MSKIYSWMKTPVYDYNYKGIDYEVWFNPEEDLWMGTECPARDVRMWWHRDYYGRTRKSVRAKIEKAITDRVKEFPYATPAFLQVLGNNTKAVCVPRPERNYRLPTTSFPLPYGVGATGGQIGSLGLLKSRIANTKIRNLSL